jgi:tetratricopeptide (TPR) repeat protein
MAMRIAFAFVMALTGALARTPQVDDWLVVINQAAAAESAGDYPRAVECYRDAVRIGETFHAGDPRRAFALNGLGMAYDYLGRYTDSETAYRRALDAVAQAPRPSPLDRSMVLANLSTLYIEMGQTSRSEKLLVEALALHKAAGEPDKLRLSIVQNSLAELMITKGNLAEAERLLTTCVAFLEGHPEAPTETGIAKKNLGVVRMYQGKFADAVRLLEESIAALKSGRSPEHPIMLRTLNNLAAARLRNGERDEAGKDWQRAVDLAASHLGMEHPLYAEILANYGRYLRETGNKAKGKKLESQAIQIMRASRRRNGIGGVVDVSALRQVK